jgi:membrane AbrB-like protein
MARDDVQIGAQPAVGAPPPRNPSPWKQAIPVVLALIIGTIGGAAFKYLTSPLPWMLGSMAFVTIAVLSGLKLRMPGKLRGGMITVLGVMLGSSFTPDIIKNMGQWVFTISALAVWMVAVGVLALIYFRVIAKYDPVTAYFSATPGGLNEMVMIGGQMGGDDRVISMTHAARIMLVVVSIPLWYRFDSAFHVVLPPGKSGLLEFPLADIAILTACAVGGYLLARVIRIPAGPLVGPMVLSAAVHLAGLTSSQPPTELVAAAQVVIGATIGCRFMGMPLSRIGRVVMHAFTIATAYVLARWTGLPLAGLVLAFAPGGLAEMSLVALALSIDVALVASHHIARIVMVVFLAPAIFRWSRRRKT